MPSNFCQFCGSPKDASGGCLCNVATVPAGVAGTAVRGSMPQPGYAPMAGGDTVIMGQGAPLGSYGDPSGGMHGAGGTLPGSAGRLLGVEGPYTGQVFPLTGANMVVGREAGKDIVLSADSTISRTHASLVYEGPGIVVCDSGSSNGTFVNGMRVTSPVALVPGDIVQFGSSKFRVE